MYKPQLDVLTKHPLRTLCYAAQYAWNAWNGVSSGTSQLVSFCSDSLDVSPPWLPALCVTGGFGNSAAMQMYTASRGSGQRPSWGPRSRDIKAASQTSPPPAETHRRQFAVLSQKWLRVELVGHLVTVLPKLLLPGVWHVAQRCLSWFQAKPAELWQGFVSPGSAPIHGSCIAPRPKLAPEQVQLHLYALPLPNQ